MDTRAQRTPRSQPVKRRACEECRTRKLGCTKEPSGCSRCIRDGVRCHYSAQKPMGRPRKSRQSQVHVEESQGNQPATTSIVEQVVDPAIVPASDSAHANPNPVDLDLDMAFFDMNDMSFFDLLMPNASQGNMNHVSTAPEPPKQPPIDPTPFMAGTHLLGDINFDAPPPSHPQPLTEEFTPSQLTSLITSELTTAFPTTTPPLTNPSTSLPSLSPPSTTSSKTPSPPPTPLPPCSCISSLYLALDSLQRLPRTVSAAMKVARTVAKTCHNTILCPTCANPPITIHDGSYNPPITSFQSMMMLGAILPSLSNAYKQILDMVDTTTSTASSSSQNLTFDLASYGGLWGMLGASDNICGAADKVDGAVLDPGMWRLTVRALLKIDVYGIDGSTAGWGGAVCTGFRQPGLKNIIAMMEERARLRHEALDGMMARGEVNDHTRCGQYYSLCSASKPTCLRIIDIAKQSMRTLDIP